MDTGFAAAMQVVDVRWYAAHCVAMMNQLVCNAPLQCALSGISTPAVSHKHALCLLVI